jgi:DNA polymerase-3 subunit epsilon
LGRLATHGPSCVERELSPCPAPRGVTAADYVPIVAGAERLIAGADDTPLRTALAHLDELSGRGRYEIAARLRDHAATAIDGLWRGQRLRTLTCVDELVAARPDGAGGWQLAIIRHGQLAAAGNAIRGVPPMPVVDAICAGAQVILPYPAPLGGALVEETGLLTRWLGHPGVRIVRADPGYATPLGSAGRLAGWSATARSARIAAAQATDDDDEMVRMLHPRLPRNPAAQVS